MQQTILSWHPPHWVTAIVAVWALVTLIGSFALRPVEAASEESERVVTVYDGGSEFTFATSAETVGEAIKRGEIELGERDAIEPSAGTELVAKNYHINIYRARPVVVVDGDSKTTVVTPKQSGREIAESTGVSLYPEDIAKVDRVDDALINGAAVQRVTIDRATVFTFLLYGEKQTARTHASTVGEFLKEIEVELADNDMTSLSADAPIKEGMELKLWREGKQTISVEEKANFPVRQIQDSSREVGYRNVRTVGQPGKKTVVYEIVIKDGKEVSRKKIQSVIKVKPVEQVEVVGTKPSFSGSFGQALAKLRSCEGNYDSINERAASSADWYYGAYQFNRTTWAGAAPAGYENVRPDQAPPQIQDQAARNLYERRGWQPWPSCGASLPDTYR